MSRDEVDRTLARLRDERERISTTLLELEAHHGHRLPEGATLGGETRRVQSEVRQGMASLWNLFDLYGRGRTLGGHRPGLDWNDLAERVAGLERASGAGLERPRETAGVIRGLLNRREELRGRLDAYRAKAARLGHAEDAELARRYEQARELLWTSHCDLRAAAVALSGYQQAVNARAKGTKR